MQYASKKALFSMEAKSTQQRISWFSRPYYGLSTTTGQPITRQVI